MGRKKPEDFIKSFPTGKTPAIIDGEFKMQEGAAIMTYLAEKHGMHDWWPASDGDDAALQRRARITEYLSNHHLTTRMMAYKVFRPYMVSMLDKSFVFEQERASKAAIEIATTFQEQWLPSNGNEFIAGDQASIADLMAYCEIAQVSQMEIMEYQDMPRLSEWLRAMAAVPHHDDAHKSLLKLAAMRRAMLEKTDKP